MTRTLARLIFLAACAPVFACGDRGPVAKNTPEDAFETLRSAVRDSRWGLLYDVVPPDYQAEFDRMLAESDERITAHANEAGEAQADEVMLRDFGITYARWKAMSNRERFATVFFVRGRNDLTELGLNPDQIASSSVRASEVMGDRATLLVDDGKGHRSKVPFRLVGDRWYLDPEAIE